MNVARNHNPTGILQIALDDLIHGGNWVGEKKELLNYVVGIRNPTDVEPTEHEIAVNMLDDWHGEGHFEQTVNWTFPDDPKTGLTGDLKPSEETGDYFEALVTPENQLEAIVEKINQWGRVNRACAQVWDRTGDVNAMYPPCLMTIQALYRNEEIHLTAYFRSHTVAKSYYGDLIALARIQKWIANEVGAGVGELTVISGSLHIRKKNDENELAENMHEELLA